MKKFPSPVLRRSPSPVRPRSMPSISRGFTTMSTRMNPEDRAAFADARIAAVHAGLKLTPIRRSCGRRSRPRCGISPSCGSIAPMRG